MEPKWSLWAWSQGVEGCYLPFKTANISKLTTWARYFSQSQCTLPPSKKEKRVLRFLLLHVLVWCSPTPILLSLSLHVIWNQNGAFEHVVKEWKAVTSLLRCDQNRELRLRFNYTALVWSQLEEPLCDLNLSATHFFDNLMYNMIKPSPLEKWLWE